MTNKYIKIGIGITSAAILAGAVYLANKPADIHFNDIPTNAITVASPLPSPLEKKVIPRIDSPKTEIDNLSRAMEMDLAKTLSIDRVNGHYQFDIPDRGIYTIETAAKDGFVKREEINSRKSIYRFIDRTGKAKGVTNLSYEPGFQIFTLPADGVYDLWIVDEGKSTYQGIVNRNKEEVSIVKNLLDQRTFKEMNGINEFEGEGKGLEKIPEPKTAPENDKFVPFSGVKQEGEYQLITGPDGQPILLK
jgi:hypothetical protein